MANFVAKTRGYFGGMIREAGEVFSVPADQKPPKWARLQAFGGKGDHDGDGRTGGAKPAAKPVATSEPAVEGDAIVVPPNWRGLGAAARKALALKITGERAANVAEADRVIAAYAETSASEPFADAPEPETIKGNGVTEAIGGVQPDWIAPGATETEEI